MKLFFFSIGLCLMASTTAIAQGYTITLKAPGYQSGLAYLTYHMGKNLNIEDSAVVSNQGVAVFKGKKTLPGGIYAIVFPGKNLTADFFIDKEQNISIFADTSKLSDMKVTGSPANDLFKSYQQYVNVKGLQMQQERTLYNASKTAADSALHQENYNKYNKELNDYRAGMVKDNPDAMMSVLLSAMKDPELPNAKPVTHQDSVDNYQYYKKHYWDGVTFMDDRVIRTPFFLPKLERYYREVLPQASDSIIADIDYKLLLARNEPEMYKFLLNWLTDEYINPKYMGQDAVFVHLFEKYHSKGLTGWLNEKQMETITRRAYMQMSNLIGEKAANLEMVDTAGKPTPLYGIQADYVLMIFWDPTCGHCKEELPHIDSIYRASWKAKGLKIYAVLTEDKQKEWKQYINEHHIADWHHVYETKETAKAISEAQRPGYRQLYDVLQTPTLFLLDKDKRIIGKKLNWKQLNEFLETKWSKSKEP